MTESNDREPDEPQADTPQGSGEPALRDALLEAPVEADGRRWAYPLWAMVLVSVFVAYHSTLLFVWNTPAKNLGQGVHKFFNDNLSMRDYFRTVGATQSWAMFAPNPHRSNMFMRVLVEDFEGEIWDLKHDIYKSRRYPYIFYSRMGKINRRIIGQDGYRRHYAAWVCREWERTHNGEPAKNVQFVKMWTRIPPPDRVIAAAGWNIGAMWYDPNLLELHQVEEDTVTCARTQQAQLPPRLRARYGLPETERRFKGVYMRTWWHHRQQEKREEARQ